MIKGVLNVDNPAPSGSCARTVIDMLRESTAEEDLDNVFEFVQSRAGITLEVRLFGDPSITAEMTVFPDESVLLVATHPETKALLFKALQTGPGWGYKDCMLALPAGGSA